MPHLEERPVMTWEELRGLGAAAAHSRSALLSAAEFLKAVKTVSGHSITRRTLQLYSSPQFRLVPLPVSGGRRGSQYLHPENTLRLAVVLRLRNDFFFPIKRLREVIDTISPDHYPVVLRHGLTAAQIFLLARPEMRGLRPRELIFMHMLGLLNVVETQDKFVTDGPLDEAELLAAEAKFRGWLEARTERAPAAIWPA